MAGVEIDTVFAAGRVDGLVASLTERRVVAVDPYSIDLGLTRPRINQVFGSAFESV